MKRILTAFLFVVLLIPLQAGHATDLTLPKDTSIQVYFSPEFGLWSGNDALFESCRIIAGKQDLHVDDASCVIIKALWVRLKKEDRLNIIES